MATKLTVKQQRFVDFYDGNATDAARKAGYKNPKQIGTENLSKLAKHLRARETKRNGKDIANREERQRFWTDMMRGRIDNDLAPLMIKGSELLGRSEADFTDKIQASVTHGLDGRLNKSLKAKGKHGKA